jgi:hypothetical protein
MTPFNIHPTHPRFACENVRTFEMVYTRLHPFTLLYNSFDTSYSKTLYSYKCEWLVGSRVCSVWVVDSFSSFITLENGLKLGPDASTIPARG